MHPKRRSRFFLSSSERADERKRRERFAQLLLAADEIAALNKQALPSMVRALARPLQARRLTQALENKLHGAPKEVNFDDLFFPTFAPLTGDGQTLYDLTRRDRTSERVLNYKLRLSRDIVLPAAWHRGWLVNTLANIGSSKSAGAWRPDVNHSVELILPFGLGRVLGGNHSITAGIADGEGWVPAKPCDLSKAYAHVVYDGVEFVRKHDGAVLSSPAEEESGILFEIGRLMVKLGVEYDAPVISDAEKRDLMQDDRYTGLYQVWIDGRDTGNSVGVAAIERAMHELGILRTDPRWSDVLYEQFPITPEGTSCEMTFVFVAPRPRLSDVKHVLW